MRPMASMMRTVSATPQLWATTARGTTKLPRARRARATTPAPSQPRRLLYSLCIDRERAIPNACFCSKWHSRSSKASLPVTVFCSEESSLARLCFTTCEIVICRILLDLNLIQLNFIIESFLLKELTVHLCLREIQCLVHSSSLSRVSKGSHVYGFLFQPRVSVGAVLKYAWRFLLCSLHMEGFLLNHLMITILCTSDSKPTLNYLFCRTWLEQKPVQFRSLRTGVENHYVKSLNKEIN